MKNKKLSLTFLALLASLQIVLAQGTFLFSNLTEGVDVPIGFDDWSDNIPPKPLTGPEYGVRVRVGVEGNVLSPPLESVFFSDDPEYAGYFFGPVVEVPGTSPGDIVPTEIEAFSVNGDFLGFSLVFDLQLGGGSLPPGTFVNLQPFDIVVIPEPSTWALTLLGGLALFFFKRRRPKHS